MGPLLLACSNNRKLQSFTCRDVDLLDLTALVSFIHATQTSLSSFTLYGIERTIGEIPWEPINQVPGAKVLLHTMQPNVVMNIIRLFSASATCELFTGSATDFLYRELDPRVTTLHLGRYAVDTVIFSRTHTFVSYHPTPDDLPLLYVKHLHCPDTFQTWADKCPNLETLELQLDHIPAILYPKMKKLTVHSSYPRGAVLEFLRRTPVLEAFQITTISDTSSLLLLIQELLLLPNLLYVLFEHLISVFAQTIDPVWIFRLIAHMNENADRMGYRRIPLRQHIENLISDETMTKRKMEQKYLIPFMDQESWFLFERGNNSERGVISGDSFPPEIMQNIKSMYL